MRFQTKLMWAFVIATTLVTASIIQLTSARVKRNYEQQFRDRFDSHVSYLIDARHSRTERDQKRAEKLAKQPYILNQLNTEDKTKASDLKKQFFELANSLNRDTSSSLLSRKMSNQLMAVMGLDGQIKFLAGRDSAGYKRIKSRNNMQSHLEQLSKDQKQQLAYLPRTTASGEEKLREIIFTPVIDPDSGKILGAFLLGVPDIETSAERIIQNYYKNINGDSFETATLFDSQLYLASIGPNRRSPNQTNADKQKSNLESVTTQTLSAIDKLADGETRNQFEATIKGKPHLVHFCALNPDSPLSMAWQLSAFPTTKLKQDLYDLRIKGSGIGLIGLLIGCLAAWILSRNLSIPITELTSGTRRVIAGDLNTELKVRSNDEIGELTDSFNKLTEDLRQKQLYRELLGKVSDESVAQAMIEGSLDPRLGGELKEISVLFCDIRGFTSLTETMRPEQVIEMLNIHMTAMANVVRDNHGVVDKFVGDEIMAVFGGLKSSDNDAIDAARCALQMLEERQRINHESGENIQIGIGLATGEMVAGCMGSEDRLNYTILGARVNLGARLCGQAGPGEIVMDDNTGSKLSELNPNVQAMDELHLKGFAANTPAWKLIGY